MTKINDVIEIAADAIDEIGPIKALKKVWDKITTKKLTNLFKNCANQLNCTGNIEDEFKAKLNEYTESDFGQEVVYSLVQKAINSESINCSRILGIILGIAMLQNRSLNHEERILSRALSQMIDYDLVLLNQIHSKIHQLPIPQKIIDDAKGDQNMIRNSVQNNSVSVEDFFMAGLLNGDPNEAYYSVERMKGLHILTATALHGGWSKTGTNGLLKPTQLSFRLVDLSRKVV